ncbi:unnamed protein product, partial [Staurois parvus]
MYVKWFDTVMFYYVILVKLSNFPPVPSPYVLTSQGNGTRKTDAGISRTLPGTLQVGH